MLCTTKTKILEDFPRLNGQRLALFYHEKHLGVVLDLKLNLGLKGALQEGLYKEIGSSAEDNY